ncbi:hypothetical protein Tco_0746407 [Tanacetum coccineum]
MVENFSPSCSVKLGHAIAYLGLQVAYDEDKVFTVNLHRDGVFICNPVSELKEGNKELKTEKDVDGFLKGFLTIKGNVNDTPFESSDESESSDDVEEIDYVDFHTEGMYSNKKYVAKRKLFADDSPRIHGNIQKDCTSFAKEIINDPFMPYIKLKDAIRQKFMIDDYRQALLESNPGSTCRLDVKKQGELLTAMGRNANNQMYPIAWAVALGFDSPKSDGPQSGIQLQKLFWQAASCTVPQLFYSKMEEMKQINTEAYNYLIGRDPNSWSRAFFNLTIKFPAFENGICIGHNKASCDKELVPKVPIQRRPPGRTRKSVFGTHASARGHGRGSRGGRGARGGRNGSRRGARGGRNGTSNRGQQLMDEDEIRENLEHDYMQDLLDTEEDKRIQQDREYQKN